MLATALLRDRDCDSDNDSESAEPAQKRKRSLQEDSNTKPSFQRNGKKVAICVICTWQPPQFLDVSYVQRV